MVVGKVEQDQERLLDEASSLVKEQAAHMKRAIENECLRDAVKHASNMLCEMRTSLLSPKNYYELYMLVFHELQHLAAFFGDKKRHGRKMSELYESVQHAGNIVPRLYLLVTVGSCYIRSNEAPEAVKAILTDMTELCKGVQHPMRGLFLRYYLTQMCKDKLPDTGSEFESEEGGDITDAFEFLFQNFCEAARLWVRLQHQGAARERQKREKERHDLRVLVGANLVRMAQLEGMTTEFYANVAAPRILKQITSFKDVLAQQYLLDCVVQVFSDDCHLHTLGRLLDSFLNTQPHVDLKPILLNLMNRLSEFAKQTPEPLPESVDIFGLFHSHILQLFQRFIDNFLSHGSKQQLNRPDTARSGAARSESSDGKPSPPGKGGSENLTTSTLPTAISLSNLLEIQVAFLSFTLVFYPTRIDYVDRILCAAVNLLTSVYPDLQPQRGTAASRTLDGPPAALESVMELLAAPLRTFSLDILHMDHFPNLMRFLGFRAKKKVATAMVAAVLDAGNPLENPEATARFFSFVSPLLKESEAGSAGGEWKSSDDSFFAEQQQVCRLLHLIHHVDTDEEFAMLSAARACVAEGGSARRVAPLLSGLVFCLFRLVPRVVSRELGHGESEIGRIGSSSHSYDDAGLGDDLAALRLGSDGEAAAYDLNGQSFESSDQKSSINETKKTPPTSPPNISAQKVFHAIHRICIELVPHQPETAINLFLTAATVANDAENRRPGPSEAICYEFLTQALVCFEEELSESKAQVRALTMLVGTICTQINCLEADNYDNLAAKVTQHSARLLRKADACRAVLLCSNLFWHNIVRRNEGRVLECLQKCLKIADVALTSSNAHVVLFVEILEKYTFFFTQNVPGISQQSIVDLVSLCAEHLQFAELSETCAESRRHFRNIVKFIWQKEVRDKDPKFKGMKIESAEGINAFLSSADDQNNR